jgi:hypothetical protein
MFDAEGYDSRLSSDIYEFRSIVWTNQKRKEVLFQLYLYLQRHVL